jgi:flagellar protein FliJ
MAYQYKFDKILHIKEIQKNDALADYQTATEKFEETATKLYELLKRKEDLETYQSEQLNKGLSIQKIRHHQQFITNLEKSIECYQKMVINARNRMEFFKEKLIERNVEEKKFVKMKEKDLYAYQQELKFLDSKQMDDISIQQFNGRGN